MIEGYDILTARFVDVERKTVEVLWKDPNSDKIVSEYVEANNNDITWKYLVQEYKIKTIHDNTNNYTKQLKTAYEKELEEIAKRNGDWDDLSNDNKFFSKLIDTLLKNEKNIKGEDLFKFKLFIFDHPKMALNLDSETKSFLRKAKTYKEIMKILGDT